MSAGGPQSKSTPFTRIGRGVYRQRKLVIAFWIIALVAAVPLISQVAGLTSLQQGSATGSQLESVQADKIVSEQFAKSVPNSTLIIVVSASNVTSPQIQKVVADLVSALKHDQGIIGLNQSIDVYSRLYAAIGGVNSGTHAAYDGANSTAGLLLGVPALYLGAWLGAFSSTHDVNMSNFAAYSTANSTLYAQNSTAYDDYTFALLNLTHSAWLRSWNDSSLATASPIQRMTQVAATADSQYIPLYLWNSSEFSHGVLQAVPFNDFFRRGSNLSSDYSHFAVSQVSASSGFSPKFVNASYNLGRSYNNASLYALAGSIAWSPGRYQVDTSVSTLIASFLSPTRNTTLVSLGLDRSSTTNVLEVRKDVATVLGSTQGSGVESILVTGQDAISHDFQNSTQSDLDLILPVTIALLIVATGLFFRSILTPFITLGTIGVALGISQVFVVLVALFIAKVDFTIPTILLTVMIGVGTDYSVFVIARYREERVRGLSVQDAVETSVTWAGESIATSGATVIISFLSLSLTSVVFLRTMGIAVGLGVLVALAVALTLVPAIISLTGGRTFWPTSGKRFEAYSARVSFKLETKRGYFSRSGAFSVKRAKVLIVLAIVASVPALYVYSTTVPTYDFLSAAPTSLESISASDHLTSAFGGGRLFPTYVVVTFDSALVSGNSFRASEMGTVGNISDHIATVSDVRNVSGPTRPFGAPVDYQSINFTNSDDARVLTRIMQSIGSNDKTALIIVNLGIDPYSTKAITDAQAIRDSVHALYGAAPHVTGIYVGGASGGILDTKNVFDAQFSSIVPIVAVGVALVLLVVLGSLFLPFFAVLSVLMSIVWTLAATKLVFQTFFNYQILFITPFFLFVTLLGLGMDYNIFILTRIREEATKGKRLDDAIVSAIEQTGGIITAAAIILAGSLGALTLSSDLLLKQIGFAFAYSILIDALIVRTYLVPAVMSTMGRWNWFSPIPYLDRSHALFKQGSEKPPEA